jgi:hypothetical protein
MTASTMLLLKISRTKKRLSSNIWQLPIIIIALLALLTFLSSALRGISVPRVYGIVEAEIPVIPALSQGQSTLSEFDEKTRDGLSEESTVIVLTADRFYFGTLNAFAEGFSEVNNKFYIPHIDGAPDVPKLVSSVHKWQLSREDKSASSAVFLPSENVPMPIVIQCIAALKDSGLFKNVVLGGGLL